MKYIVNPTKVEYCAYCYGCATMLCSQNCTNNCSRVCSVDCVSLK